MKKLLFLTLSMCLFVACSQKVEEEPATKVNATRIEKGTTALQIEFPGQVAGSIDIDIRAQVGGILKERLYTEGTYLTKDTPMFIIDPQPYQVALQKAEGTLARAESELKRTKREYDRMNRLFKQNAVSAKEHDEALSAYDNAQANLKVAQAGVSEAKINLDYTTVKAPIDGIAGKENQTVGSLVSPAGMELTTMVQINPLFVNFSVPSRTWALASKIFEEAKDRLDIQGEGLNVRIVLENGDVYPHIGKIFFADSTEDLRTASISVKAEVPNPDFSSKIMPGQFVKVQFLGYNIKDSIVLPVNSVMQEDYGEFVYVIKDGVIEKQPVKIGVSGSTAFILEGLNTGDIVMIDGLVKVKPGQKAEPNLLPNPAVQTPEQIEKEKEEIKTAEEELNNQVNTQAPNICDEKGENCSADTENNEVANQPVEAQPQLSKVQNRLEKVVTNQPVDVQNQPVETVQK